MFKLKNSGDAVTAGAATATLPFRGVASPYLGNYLGWRWALDGGRVKTPDALLQAALGVRRPAMFHT
jgi:hypothetical protein